ncbi:hypothetical protein HG535_0F03290 [Zygotorulaspora mrakii]|uniref:RING-type E3 ubiquitin transferase n=1 Tax=Zygotorulaspora mrakii TaxID=42260 RepID=A0A7H9B549_ZYGMR|nr:uncharacterized protein HG535_0F03290 [Zygotorulaspora mrakii]QLG73818.1 hypothetical protein HG535_0F03290 [Zygotorulaspora mrakii]
MDSRAEELLTGIQGDASTYDDVPAGASCRICRGEHTTENPLFHPCKCKGSIKYIHESCLMEWIASKNIDITKSGTVVNCDICHYPINFKTKYAENMPERIPMSLLLKRSCISHFFRLKEIITIVLAAVLFLIGVPLTWNFFGKLYTFILDRELPYRDDFLKSIIFGFSSAPIKEDIESSNILLQMVLNYRFSILQIIMVVILHISLYFQYDMIVRESVFSKMVFHKIGPQYTKEELIKIQLKERFPMMDDETIENVAKIMKGREEIRNLAQQENNHNNNPDNADNEEESDDEQENANQNEEQPGTENTNAFADEAVNESQHESNAGLDSSSILAEQDSATESESESEVEEQIEDIRPLDAFVHHRAQNELDELLDQNLQAAADHPAAGPEHIPVQPAAQVLPQAPEPIPAPRIVDEEIVNDIGDANNQIPQAPIIINLKLKLMNVIAYYIIAVVLIAVYLSASYLLPTFTGFGLLKCYAGLVKILLSGLFQLCYLLHLPRFYATSLTKIPQMNVLDSMVKENIIASCVKIYQSYNTNAMKSSVILRSVPALVSYTTTISLINISSELICKGFGRENGMKNRSRRFIFQILFAIKCTFKVFILFFIELAAFPVLTGLMLDFSLFCPILRPGEIFWAPRLCEDWPPSIFFLYWGVGTLYMYWFARYIGMIRKHIIRPGVLFFIRSPDDPNIKILHDSLIHPMSIQISRLCLSMFIYAVFIIVGFGFHTRFLFPVLMKSKMLTIQNGFLHHFGVDSMNPKWEISVYPWPFYIAKQVIESTSSVKLYIRKYWTRVFDVSSRKLRLSSFMLNNDIPTERGCILYRNWFYRSFARRKAQWSNSELYTSPKTASRAAQLFKENKAVHAYFIPDGILMRVPSSDIISRTYVQTLFVPVTKDDKLLKPLDLQAIEEKNTRNAGEFGYLDEQNTEYDGYSIVYTPPNFRSRYILLLVFVWLFASLLVLTTTFASQFTFTLIAAILVFPAYIFAYVLANVFLVKSPSKKHYEVFYNGYITVIRSNFQHLDIFFVCFGAIALALMLERYHQLSMSRIKLEEHIVPVAIDGEEFEVENLHNERVDNHSENQIESWGTILKHVLNRDEIKVVLYLTIMVIMVWLNSLGVIVNMEQLYFIQGYFFHDTFKGYRGVFNGFWNPSSLQTNACFTLLSIHFIYTQGLNFAANRNRSFFPLFRYLLKESLRKLKFMLYTTMPIIVSWLACSTLEYLFHRERYTTFGAPLVFLWRYRLKSEFDHIEWTFPQHLCYLSVTAILATFAISHLVKFVKKWFGDATQNVKDEVYAQGRSLENFTNDNF